MVRPSTSAPSPTTVGTAGVVDGRWIDEAVYRQALRNATDSNRRHLLQLYEGYKLMSVRTPFRDLLSAEQRASYFYIDRIEQWNAVAERFQAEVDKFRWLFNQFRLPRLRLIFSSITPRGLVRRVRHVSFVDLRLSRF